MNWNHLLSARRFGFEQGNNSVSEHDRSEFQRDYDRIIFSAAFRRMQNKTQVFPLPGSIFVHNRLTHSLEVASVGRSLGNKLAEELFRNNELTDPGLLTAIGSVVSAACLAHDMGNPPFGHSGESAISNYFLRGEGKRLQQLMKPSEWLDFVRFDGNANAFRLLSHRFNGKRSGGFALTCTTMASIVKYPYESVAATTSKLGFFQSEKESWEAIANELMLPVISGNPVVYSRHPLVYLVEAADDICYQIMDVEDAYRLGILSYQETVDLFMGFHSASSPDVHARIDKTMQVVSDPHEQISYLRAGIIGILAGACFDVFIRNYESIMSGTFKGSLMKNLDSGLYSTMKQVQSVSVSRIYNHRSVVEIEIAGYKIIGTLMEEFVNAMFDPSGPLSEKLLMLLPSQYLPADDRPYTKVQSVVDFISGMTDVYALELYRKIKGINLPEIV